MKTGLWERGLRQADWIDRKNTEELKRREEYDHMQQQVKGKKQQARKRRRKETYEDLQAQVNAKRTENKKANVTGFKQTRLHQVLTKCLLKN